MPLEDDFCDIIRKARTGQGLGIAEVGSAAGLAVLRLEALEAGQMPSAGEVERLAQVLFLRGGQLREIALGIAEPPPAAAVPDFAVTAVYAADVGGFAYAVRRGEDGFLVDCGGYVPQLLAALGGRPKGVLLTHGHRDHVAGLGELPEGVPVYAHPELSRRIPGARPLLDNETVLGLRASYAPGHSPDMLALIGDGLAFVGDTIFAGSLGRSDTAESYPVLLATARRILSLPRHTKLFCGHGPVTTVGWEREHNAFPVV